MTPSSPRPKDRRLLLVEDNPGDVDLVREYLGEAEGSDRLEVRETLADAMRVLDRQPYDLVLLDLNLPDSRGLETLDAVLDSLIDAPVVVLTGLDDSELGAEAVHRGAQDFLPKDEITAPVLARTIRHAIERHRHERELREAEKRAQSYLEIADVLMVALDREGRITMINPAGARLLGYDASGELEGRSFFEVAFPPEDRDRLREAHRTVLAGERDFENPRQAIRTRSGEERILAWKSSVLRNGRGRTSGTLSCGLDVTERERARGRLELLNEALQSAHNGIVITDREGRIEWANPAFTGMTGYTLPEALGRTPGELIASGHHDAAFYADLWETILAGDVWEGRMVNLRKDGTLYPEEQTITPVVDASGEIAHFIAVKQDVTERVASEKELKGANRALRVISGANQSLVRSSSEEEILEAMCRVAVEVGGYRFSWIGLLDQEDPTRILPVAHRGEGEGYLEALDPSLVLSEASAGPVGRAVRTGSPVVVREIDAAEDSGSWEADALRGGYRSKIAIPLVAADRCLGVLSIYSEEPDAFDEEEIEILSEVGEDLAHGIATHRTQRRKAELEDQLHQAEKLRAVGQLAGGVAHDFNNYLTVITTLTDMVLEESELGAGVRADLGEIQDAARSSARLTRQLLAFSRQQVATLEVLDLGEAVREMTSMLGRLLEESIEIELRVGDAPLPVRVDPGQLEQVLMNLAVNARDAMPDGGTLTIEARAMELTGNPAAGLKELEPGPYALLAVSDTGSGISEEERPRIFEPFFTAKEGGTGLGLSTVYGIVKQAGGEIQMESEVGRGTRFEILLPLRNEEELSEGSGIEASPDSVEGTERIVLVEDQPAVRRAVRRILGKAGYEILECGSVSEALALNAASDLPFHLLLTDLGLPDGDGREVAEAFLAARPELVVIYTSGYTPTEMDLTLELGPRQHFIEKPFDLSGLVQRVRSALDAAEGFGNGAA